MREFRVGDVVQICKAYQKILVDQNGYKKEEIDSQGIVTSTSMSRIQVNWDYGDPGSYWDYGDPGSYWDAQLLRLRERP